MDEPVEVPVEAPGSLRIHVAFYFVLFYLVSCSGSLSKHEATP